MTTESETRYLKMEVTSEAASPATVTVELVPASSCQGPLIAEGREDAARAVCFLGILLLVALICWGIWAAAT